MGGELKFDVEDPITGAGRWRIGRPCRSPPSRGAVCKRKSGRAQRKAARNAGEGMAASRTGQGGEGELGNVHAAVAHPAIGGHEVFLNLHRQRESYARRVLDS